MKKQAALELIDFLYASPTAFHSVLQTESYLMNHGYTELKETDSWSLQAKGKYYVKKNDSALIAFEIGTGDIVDHGIRMIGAHTDSPGFRVKAKPEMVTEGTYLKLNTEGYGGPLLYTWFDRPLGLAGKVTLKGETPLKPITKLVNINKPLLIIPSLAIHMNRSVNEGFEVNKQNDTLPLLGLVNDQFEKDNYLVKLLADELNVNHQDIMGFDLSLYEYEKGSLVGMNEEFISCGGLDDMWMVYAGVKALVESKDNAATKMMICMDNEEIGSLTAQGANSNFIPNIIERVTLALGKGREDMHRTLAQSVMISADLAHAVHPNAAQKHDPTNRPVLGKGPVLKIAASGSYSTDSNCMAIFEGLCQVADIPYQKFYNRSDVRGGTTIGPVTSSILTIPVMDMGAPLLGMHSVRELATVEDHDLTVKLFTTFFGA
ncbi:M18 family aminopeptidase [Turicibacter sp. TJ11]|uniref:M18 family aminopeptidase n=1 Tax=Turicibacter sp. TJ11 TaxID=2806443 RepID=UPI001F2B4AD0|nr:M18 family aminopeptidase [Turicibacter sp. TJ11]